MADVDLSAAASAGAQQGAQDEIDAQGGPSLDMDVGAVVEAAAGAAAAGACAAYGLAVAAPLCAYVGSEVAGFVVDNIAAPIGEFFSGLFGASESNESLITVNDLDGMWHSIGYESGTEAVSWWYPLNRLPYIAFQAGLQQYGIYQGLQDLYLTGIELTRRRVDFFGELDENYAIGDWYVTSITHEVPSSLWPGTTEPRGDQVGRDPIVKPLWPPDFQLRYCQRFHDLPLDTADSDAPPLPTRLLSIAAPIRRDLLATFIADTVQPYWRQMTEQAFPAVTAAIQAKAVAARVQQEMWAQLASLTPTEQAQLQELQALSQLSPEEAQQLRDWAALAALSEAEREQLRQLQELAGLTPEEQAALVSRFVASSKLQPVPEDQRSGSRATVRLAGSGLGLGALYILPRLLL